MQNMFKRSITGVTHFMSLRPRRTSGEAIPPVMRLPRPLDKLGARNDKLNTNILRKSCIIVTALLLLLLPFFKPAYAQEDFYVASTFELEGEIENNDIVSRDANGKLSRSSINYDTNIFGVVVETAPMVYRTTDTGKPIARSGDVAVNVSTINGPIKIGDPITSSTIAGKGQKASNQAGYILGYALEDLKTDSAQKIKVSLAIGPGKLSKAGAVANIFDQFGSLLFKNMETATQTQTMFRYFIAGIVSIAAFFIGFTAFGKNVAKGIEAIGRNPLAKKQIQAMILINIILIAVVTVAGVALSLAIIRF